MIKAVLFIQGLQDNFSSCQGLPCRQCRTFWQRRHATGQASATPSRSAR